MSQKTTPFLKIQLLSIAAGLSYMGSSLTTFAVILRDKDAVGPTGVSIILLAMLVPNVLMAPFSGQIADRFESRVVVPATLVAMSASTLSIALVPLVIWFVISLIVHAGASYEEARAWIGSPLPGVILICLIIAAFHHAQLGLQVVIEDYIHAEPCKIAAPAYR